MSWYQAFEEFFELTQRSSMALNLNFCVESGTAKMQVHHQVFRTSFTGSGYRQKQPVANLNCSVWKTHFLQRPLKAKRLSSSIELYFFDLEASWSAVHSGLTTVSDCHTCSDCLRLPSLQAAAGCPEPPTVEAKAEGGGGTRPFEFPAKNGWLEVVKGVGSAWKQSSPIKLVKQRGLWSL